MKLIKALLLLGLFICLQPFNALAYDEVTKGTTKITADVGPTTLLDDGSDNIAGTLTDNGKAIEGEHIKIYVLKEKQVRGKKSDIKIKSVWYELIDTVTTDEKGNYNLEANVPVAGNEFYLSSSAIDARLNP